MKTGLREVSFEIKSVEFSRSPGVPSEEIELPAEQV